MPIIPVSGSATARGALVPIGRVAITGTATSEISFTNIPQIYQDLQLVIEATATNFAFPYIYFNTYSSPAPSWTRIWGNGSITTSDRVTQGTSGNVGNYSYQTLSPTAPTNAEVNILNYRSTVQNKSILARGSSDQIGSGTVSLTVMNTSSLLPVVSMNIATFVAGSFYGLGTTFTLYGVRSVNQ